MKIKVLIGLLLVAVMLLAGCSPGDTEGMDTMYTVDHYPGATDTYSLGSEDYRWAELYTHRLYLDGSDISTPNYAGMYKYDSVVGSAIQVVDAWHLVNGFTTSLVGGGWGFYAGEQVPITAYADNGDGKTVVTSAGHVLVNSDVISIAGTVNYDGVWIVEQSLVNTFVIDTPFVADDGASVGEHGSHFTSGNPRSEGRYLVSYSMSIKPDNPNDVVESAIFHNATLRTESVSRTKLGAVTDYQNVVGFAFVDIALNATIGCALRNVSGAGDFLVIHANTTLLRID